MGLLTNATIRGTVGEKGGCADKKTNKEHLCEMKVCAVYLLRGEGERRFMEELKFHLKTSAIMIFKK